MRWLSRVLSGDLSEELKNKTKTFLEKLSNSENNGWGQKQEWQVLTQGQRNSNNVHMEASSHSSSLDKLVLSPYCTVKENPIGGLSWAEGTMRWQVTLTNHPQPSTADLWAPVDQEKNWVWLCLLMLTLQKIVSNLKNGLNCITACDFTVGSHSRHMDHNTCVCWIENELSKLHMVENIRN